MPTDKFSKGSDVLSRAIGINLSKIQTIASHKVTLCVEVVLKAKGARL